MTNQTHLLRHLRVSRPDHGATPRTKNLESVGLRVPQTLITVLRINTVVQLALPD